MTDRHRLDTCECGATQVVEGDTTFSEPHKAGCFWSMWALTLKDDGVCAACGHNFVVDNVHRNNVIRVCEGCGSNEFEWAWFW